MSLQQYTGNNRVPFAALQADFTALALPRTPQDALHHFLCLERNDLP